MADSLTDKPTDKPKGRGGYRPGSGRKPGTMEAATVEKIRVLEEYKAKVRAVAHELFQKQYELAMAGDRQVIDSMLDRTFGKAQANVDMTTNGKELPSPILGGMSMNVPADNSDQEASEA